MSEIESTFKLHPPHLPFTLPNQFKGMFNGDIYVGVVDSTDPKNNQIQAYVQQEDGSLVEINQPIKTNTGGFAVYNGKPATILFKQPYSMIAFSNGVERWYIPNMNVSGDASQGWVKTYVSSFTFRDFDSVEDMLNSSDLIEIGDKCRTGINLWKKITHPSVSINDFDFIGTEISSTDFQTVSGQTLNQMVEKKKKVLLDSGEINLAETIDPQDLTMRMEGSGRSTVGDGNDPDLDQTTLLKLDGATTAINTSHTSDKQSTPCFISQLMIEGTGASGEVGISQRFRHQGNIEDVYIRNCETGIIKTDTWLDSMKRVRIYGGKNGLVLDGSNHASKYEKVSLIGQSDGVSLSLNNNGTAQDQSDAVQFDNVDIEFSGANCDAYECNVDSVVTFRDSYVGEKVTGDIFNCNKGTTIYDGGVLWFANNGGKVLANLNGGNLRVQNAKVIGGTFSSYTTICSPSNTEGTFVIKDCVAGFNQGFNLVNGIYLGEESGHSYCKITPNGGWGNSGTAPSTVSRPDGWDAKYTFTGGGSVIINSGVEGSIRWGDRRYLIIEYASNFNAELKAAVNQTTDDALDHTISSIPQNGGVMSTAVMSIGNWPGDADLKFFKINGSVTGTGEFFHLRRICISDNRMAGDKAGFVKNLFFPFEHEQAE